MWSMMFGSSSTGGGSEWYGQGARPAHDPEDDVISCLRKLATSAEKAHNSSGDAEGAQVLHFQQPAERLNQLFGGGADFLKIGETGLADEEADGVLRDTLSNSVKTDHPYFLNALYHGTDHYGKVGAYLSEVMNTNAYSYEVAPVFTLVEKSLVDYLVDKLGWESGDGLTCPGGSIANMYAMVMARHRRFPDLKRTGIAGSPPMVVYTSDESHYSVAKGANWLGIGLDNVVYVPTDDMGRMVAGDLEAAIRKTLNEGKVPLMVNATVGSTVVGAFDDLVAIRHVIDKFQDESIWLHADAAWGGAYLLCPDLKSEYLPGSHLTDSWAWNPHKMLGAALQASMFVCRHPGLLHQTNSASASYLFQQDKFYDVSYDTGDKSVQCGRKTDAFKIWFMMRVRGEAWLAESVGRAHRMSRLMEAKVQQHPNFKMVLQPSCTNINFVYIPPCLKELQGQVSEDEYQGMLHKVAPEVKKRMMEAGSLMVAYQPLKSQGLGNFFRLVFHCQPQFTEDNVDFIVNEIDRLGRQITLDDLKQTAL